MNGRLFLLAHIAQANDMCELKENYNHVQLSSFEEHFLDALIRHNLNIFGNEWNTGEHKLLKLLYKKMKSEYQIEYENEYNTHTLIIDYEKYVLENSTLHSILSYIDYK